MKITDEAVWQQQCAELAATDKGQHLLDIVTLLYTEAEARLGVLGPAPVDAVRQSIDPVEDAYGRIPSGTLGQFLVLGATFWVHGAEMYSGLSTIERRLAEDCLAIQLATLAEEAAQGGTNETD